MVKKRKWNTRQEDPHQGILEAALSNIFPTRNILYSNIKHLLFEYSLIESSHVTKNVRKKVAIKNPLTGGYLEVDVWYADLKLCFEYQVFFSLPHSYFFLTDMSHSFLIS